MLAWLLTHSPLLYFTQSLWRDEVFSIFVAQRPLSFIVSSVGFEPPVYYTLLHFWIKIFGTGEIATRSLSFLGFSLATVVTIVWSEKLFKNRLPRWIVPLLFFFNPMLLYYAFEVRTYGWYMFFAILSMYSYYNKKWFWYVTSSVLAFYTHAYMAVFLAAQAAHWIFTSKKLRLDPMIKSTIAIGLLISPWIVKIILDLGRLKDSWYFPVDLHLVKSILGNMFIGYEGTPWYLWPYTAWLSALFLFVTVAALRGRQTKKPALYFAFMCFIPLALTIGISVVKPVFVNRYLIPVTIAEIFLVGLALDLFKKHVVQYFLAAAVIISTLLFNLWYPNKHPKLPIRDTMNEVNVLRARDDVVLAASPLIFFESIYYSNDPDRVFLYNPNGTAFPWYVGDAIVSPDQMVREFPPYPIRAFLIGEDGSFDIVYSL